MPETWRSADLAAMLRHQLSAMLEPDLERAFPGTGSLVRGLARGVAPELRTFRDLLFCAAPPVELLRLMKEFSKANVESMGMPQPLAALFYFAGIALALRDGMTISSLDTDQVRQGLARVLQQEWLDEATRALLMSIMPLGRMER
jgi:hypothetical protein